MATPKKQKNGKWHTQVYIGRDKNGKRIIKSITANTKAECIYLASKVKVEGEIQASLSPTVREIVEQYVDSIEQVASPTTIRGYHMTLRHGFKSLMEMHVDDVTEIVMQNAISEESQRVTQYGKPMSPKSVRNEYGLIEVALRKVCGKTFTVKLPQEVVKIKEYPLPSEIMEAIKGTDVELPCLLAMWLSLSMSEIRGLDCSSIRDGVLHVEQVRVDGENGSVLKATGKVGSRIRNHKLPTYLLNLINSTTAYIKYAETGENQPLIPMSRNEIYKHWKKICTLKGWQMTFHDLRSVSASVMLMLGIPDKYALQRGGWSSDHIYKRVYQQTFDSERQAVDRRIDEYFEQFL